MMDSAYSPGAMALSRDEIEVLIPTHITTRAELGRWEQDNINEAMLWLRNARASDILGGSFLRQLHKKMFCHVWKRAGQFRQSAQSDELKKLCDNVKDWIENKSFPEDEIALRFHHRLVAIHLFANGNGRHARLVTDLLLVTLLGRPAFSWGSTDLIQAGQDRRCYIDSLHAADKGDYAPLLKFARS